MRETVDRIDSVGEQQADRPHAAHEEVADEAVGLPDGVSIADDDLSVTSDDLADDGFGQLDPTDDDQQQVEKLNDIASDDAPEDNDTLTAQVQNDAVEHDVSHEADHQLAIHRVGRSATQRTASVAETPQISDADQSGKDMRTEDIGSEETAESTLDATDDKEGEPEADAAQPPRPPDGPNPPVGEPGDEEEPEGQGDRHESGEPRGASDAANENREDESTKKGPYTIDHVAHLFEISYGTARDVLRQTDSLLCYQSTPEVSGHRITNFPAPYINALREFQQQNGITSFKKAADRFATTLEGQSLAHGLRAEYEDRVRNLERAQGGFLTTAQAGELMNVTPMYLLQHDLVTDMPPVGDQTGRTGTFVRPRGVSADTVLQIMEWNHAAFKDPMPAPEGEYYPSSEAEKILGCSRRAVIQMASHGYIPNWRFEAESGASNRRYPQEYVDDLGEYLRDNKRLDLIEAAERFAHEHANAHTVIRGQFELGLHHLAKEGDGYIPRQPLADYLHLPQGQFWRTFGPKPDAKGYPLQYVRDRITWSGAEIADRERVTVDARGRMRWQVSSPGIREQIVGEVAMGGVPTDVARAHGIPPRTVLGWVEASKSRVGASESQTARPPVTSKEQLASAYEDRLEQQNLEVSAAGEGMGAEDARQIIVDSRSAARQFVKWVVDNEQSIMQVAASREDVDQQEITAQIQIAHHLAEQHRFYPADILTGATVFEDLRPLAQAVPLATNENPDDRPILSARQIAALRLATDLARKGRLAYFPETGA